MNSTNPYNFKLVSNLKSKAFEICAAEAFLESGFQLILQNYIILTNGQLCKYYCEYHTRMPQLESWQFSQGLPCKTPLRTHSKQAVLPQSSQTSLKPVNHSYSQMTLLTDENKTQIYP